VVAAWPITFPDVEDKVTVTPAARGRTTPEMLNATPLFTDVGGVIIRFLVTASEIGDVAEASRSHDDSVRTRSDTDLPISIGME
jgi:hypothetical protein